MEAKESAKKWDGVAGQFNDLKVPDWKEDPFLKILEKLPVWTPDSEVLDLGCGAGRYSIAVADRCGHVTGSDVSPKMIEFAKKKKEEYGKDNISFVNECWHDMDIKEKGMEKKYDLIFGHMTPAFDTVEDIEKANRACRGFCALATFAKREAPVADEFLKYMKTESRWHDENKIPVFFEHLYKNKNYPVVDYYYRDDTQEFHREEAVNFLKDRYILDTAAEADEKNVEKICDFVDAHMKNGIFVNEVKSLIVTLVWRTQEVENGFDSYKR